MVNQVNLTLAGLNLKLVIVFFRFPDNEFIIHISRYHKFERFL